MEQLEIVPALKAAVAAVPGATVAAVDDANPQLAKGPRDTGLDAILEVEIGGRLIRLIVETKQTIAFPRDAREIIWQLRHQVDHLTENGAHVLPLVAARSLSPGARELLQAERIGYFDLGGSLFIPAPGAYVLIDRPSPKPAERKINAIFAGRRGIVLQAIWEKGRDWFGINEIADRASASPATVSETLIDLERREWVSVRGAGPTKERSLSSPAQMLNAWTNYQLHAKTERVTHYYVRAINTSEISSRLRLLAERHSVDYALAGEAAAQMYAPFLTTVPQLRCRLEISGSADRVLQEMEVVPTEDGWNFAVRRVKLRAEFNFSERLEGVWITSPLQTYLDLLSAGGRAKEAAEHLRRERLSR